MQLFDILLLSVICVTAYLGPMVIRRMGPGQRTYGWMVVADLAMALVSFAFRQSEGRDQISDLLGVIAIGGAVCLVLVPPLLRDLARRLMMGERLRLARFLADVRELLQPGMGARHERELIDTILAVRSGEVDAAVDLLRERRAKTEDPRARRSIDERIVMTYLYARRWSDAANNYEAGFDGTLATSSPQLLVEMVRAYCEDGNLEAAAGIVEHLESSPLAQEPILTFLVNRARLVFLAFVGRTGAVEAIVGPAGPLGTMPDAARSYWSGVARLNAGDRTGARNSLTEAARLSGRDGRAREIAMNVLSSVDEPGVAGPHAMAPAVAELADRITVLASSAKAEPKRSVPKLSGVGLRRIPVTVGLIAANLVVAALVTLVFDSGSDLGGLVRAGANVKSATTNGEWWRLASSMFLHFGLVHLVLNMYGLWVLGKLVEQFHGSSRMFVIYVTAGLIGSIASVIFGGPATSAGASGAVFGLLGAAIIELSLHRKKYPQWWSGALLGNLLFLTAANVAIGFIYPIIDQSAHLGGLLSGAVFAAALSLKLAISQTLPMRLVVGALLVACVMAVGYGAVGAITTDYSETLSAVPTVERSIGGVDLVAPETWQPAGDYELYDPSVVVVLQLQRLPATDLDDVIAERLYAEHYGGARSAGFDSASRATQSIVSLPEPWRGRELIVEADGIGGVQHYRAVVFGRELDGEVVVGVFYLPEALSDDIGPVLTRVLTSVRLSSVRFESAPLVPSQK